MREELINTEAERYIEAWYDTYDRVRDRGIVQWMVSNVMRDIEEWAEGRDGNGSNALGFTPAESLALYSRLASVATSYNFCPDPNMSKGQKRQTDFF